MSEVKSKARTGAVLKRWNDRLSPVIGPVLLPELLRLIGEYCLSRLSWDPVLHSKRITITDADADGFGRSIAFQREPPFGQMEDRSLSGWYAALSVAPLSELAGGSDVFSWAVRVDQWQSALAVGVASADAACVAPGYGVCNKAYGVVLGNAVALPIPVHDTAEMAAAAQWKPNAVPTLAENTLFQVRLTGADCAGGS
jgi:hypothetical protein